MDVNKKGKETMTRTCENCATRKSCKPYQEVLLAKISGCNYAGGADNDPMEGNCFIPDPVIMAEETRKKNNRIKNNRMRRDRDQAMRDLGLTRVKGMLGGVYWE
jgi:hypothetical protein